jgi:hypothetical protein
MAKQQPRIHELKPQPTIAKAVAASKAHVNSVNTASQSKGKSQSEGK